MARSQPLDEGERAWLDGFLTAAEMSAYFEQPTADQRHGYRSGRWVEGVRPGRADLVRAAILHDLGKRRARLGLFGRSLAGFWQWVGGRPAGRWRLYAEHGRLTAEELEPLGAEPLVLEFARHHHGGRPEGFDLSDWDLLQASDRPGRGR